MPSDIVSTKTENQGSYGQGKSGKTERVREKSGSFKILLTKPIIYALFSHFLSASGGFALRSPSELCLGNSLGTSVLQIPSLLTPEKILLAPMNDYKTNATYKYDCRRPKTAAGAVLD